MINVNAVLIREPWKKACRVKYLNSSNEMRVEITTQRFVIKMNCMKVLVNNQRKWLISSIITIYHLKTRCFVSKIPEFLQQESKLPRLQNQVAGRKRKLRNFSIVLLTSTEIFLCRILRTKAEVDNNWSARATTESMIRKWDRLRVERDVPFTRSAVSDKSQGEHPVSFSAILLVLIREIALWSQ